MSLRRPFRATRSAGATLKARAISRLPTGTGLPVMNSTSASREGRLGLGRFAMPSLARRRWLRRFGHGRLGFLGGGLLLGLCRRRLLGSVGGGLALLAPLLALGLLGADQL